MFGEADTIKQRLKPFLFNEEHRTKTAIGSARGDAGGF